MKERVKDVIGSTLTVLLLFLNYIVLPFMTCGLLGILLESLIKNFYK